ncbi:capsid cement protein [Reyranella sp.]|uniref:capsid cement protein n=1 Tax=Reyranella sp. TaxID=1929291 RepID=UPI003D0DF63D
MTALSITATQVLLASGPVEHGIAGAAITQGQSVYLASTGKWLPAQCDGTTAEAGENGCGIALSAAGADGQPVTVAKPGAIVTLGAGAAPAAGVVYVIGPGAGSIAPVGDVVTSTNKMTALGVGLTTNRLLLFGGTYHAGAVVA